MVLRGDVNGNGEIDIGDFTYIANVALGTEGHEPKALMDIDEDGYVSIYDAQMVGMHLSQYIDITYPPDDFEVIQEDPEVIKAYGYYFYCKNSPSEGLYTKDKNEAINNAVYNPSKVKLETEPPVSTISDYIIYAVLIIVVIIVGYFLLTRRVD